MEKENVAHFSHNLTTGNGCTLGHGAVLKFIKSHYRNGKKKNPNKERNKQKP